MAKELIKTTISPAQLKNELINLFENGNTSKTNLYELLRTKYKLEKQRCLKAYDVAIKEWQETKEKAINEQIHANQTDALKSGLKSRIEWVLEIQKELDENRHEESVLDLKTGKVTRYYRALTPTERKNYIERIAKFEGMDAPTKQETSITGTTDITVTIEYTE
jgi:hypothetical protein